ncbi:DUF1501 domain-containing protein [Armatimonas sp.]|uniref:DUF1501 domain-containing protein n=1 Tax=Armatimonas sp. TaxID=1872638 RepID=UPI00374D147A
MNKRNLNITRRHFFEECGVGVGKLALAGLLTGAPLSPTRAAGSLLGERGRGIEGKPKAKHVIHLFMAGAPSQLDLFTYKPELVKLEGKPLPPSVYKDQRYAFIRADAAVLGPRFKFAKHGQCQMELSELLPHLGSIADDICLVQSVSTDQFNHAPAQIFWNTGNGQPGRPALGSWVVYGLGTGAKNLPDFVVMSTGAGISGGAANWSSGFLPTKYAGVRLRNSGDPILDVSNPAGVDAKLQRETLDLVRNLNRRDSDPEIASRIASYELAFQLQTSAPELMDLKSESKETLAMYGCDPDKPSFARACLLARRMIERGVRFVNIYHEGWDAHSDVAGTSRNKCRETDQASAALVKDLKQRGLLDETLVIWGGEFGRTPMVENNPALGRSQGRDHHPQAYTMWLAGGGIKGGMTYGATDDLGFHVVENKVHVHDLQATILHCLGLNHEKLTYRYSGRDFRLTDVHGSVVKDILS